VPRATVPLTSQAVAELVSGRLIGDGARPLTAVGPLEGADGGTLSFLASARYLAEFRGSAAGAVLVRAEHAAEPEGPVVRIVVPDPHAALTRVLVAMFPGTPAVPGVDPTARIGVGTTLGEDVVIGPYTVLGRGVVLGNRVRLGAGVMLEDRVIIGDDTAVDHHVVCYAGTVVGRRCVLKAGAVLGGTGFGYISGREGHLRVPHVGGCILGDEVDVGANSCVDRGSIDDTVIGPGTKLDNHVHVGHNARLGARCLVMGGSVIAGSAELGDGVILAGHTAIAGHLRVGHGVRVGAKSGVISSVPDGTDVTGFPARPHREFLRAQAAMYRLATIADQIEDLVKSRSGDA
jgi:UDP-3-O-[3-hydroxymyristoyl] glucosamine N-acyltransferase